MEMVTTLLFVAAGIYFVIRQFQPHALNSRTLVMMPLIFGFLGLRGLGQVQGLDAIALLSVNAVAAVALGAWRGQTFRLWTQGGQPWVQGTLATLGLWVASFALRIGLMAVGHLAGISTAASGAELMLLLSITFGAQNAIIWMRTMDRTAILA
jgi:hypothetical protein